MNAVEVPLKTWKKLERVIEKLDQDPVEWINEDDACVLLGRNGRKLSASRLYKMRREGTIPPGYYTVGVNGAIFFNKQKLMGL